MGWKFNYAPLMATKTVMLLIAELLYCGMLKRKKKVGIRILSGGILCVFATAVLPLANGLAEDFLYSSLSFAMQLILTVFWLKYCFEESWSVVIYIATAGRVTLSMASMADTVWTYIRPGKYDYANFISGQGSGFLLRAAFGMVIVFPVCYLMMGHKIKKLQISKKWEKTVWALWGLTMMVDIVIYLYNSQYVEPTAGILQNIMYLLSSLLTNILILFLLYSIYINTQKINELESVGALWDQARTQYALSKDTINAINRKCHDLKYRILAIQNEKEKTDFNDITQLLDIYDRSINTGNEVLDVILTEKNLLCADKGILIECIADGEKLQFMETTDLYILFGNLLDNCITAVESLDEDKRMIWIKVYKKNGFAIIQTENPYGKALTWRDGLPQTTKKDAGNHGFGMLSIDTVVKRYGGELNINTEDGMFRLCIIFPVSE